MAKMMTQTSKNALSWFFDREFSEVYLPPPEHKAGSMRNVNKVHCGKKKFQTKNTPKVNRSSSCTVQCCVYRVDVSW